MAESQYIRASFPLKLHSTSLQVYAMVYLSSHKWRNTWVKHWFGEYIWVLSFYTHASYSQNKFPEIGLLNIRVNAFFFSFSYCFTHLKTTDSSDIRGGTYSWSYVVRPGASLDYIILDMWLWASHLTCQWAPIYLPLERMKVNA